MILCYFFYTASAVPLQEGLNGGERGAAGGGRAMVVAAHTACGGNDHVGKDDQHWRDCTTCAADGKSAYCHASARTGGARHTVRVQIMEPASTPPGVSVRVREETGQGLRCTKIKADGQELKA